MTLAFCTSLGIARAKPNSSLALRTSLFNSSRAVHVARSRQAFLFPSACASEKAEDKAEVKADGNEEEEEQLDEAAMRAAEIHEVLIGLQDFKDRIIDDATKLAKKVRAPKKELEAALAAHPDILKIDGHIAELEEELKVLGDR